MLAPAASLLPFTVSVAVAVPPEPDSGAVPSAVLPIVNVTLPAGEAVPAEGFTVAINWVEAVAVMLTGLAANVVVVATGAVERVTVTDAVEAAKLFVGE